MKSRIIVLIALCLFISFAWAQSHETMPKFDLDEYQFGMLKKGPNSGTGSKEEREKIQEGHMANINRMAKLGKLIAAGPMGDNGDLRGIFIFKGATAEEAKALAAEDPAIKSGRLVLELLPWHAPKGIGVALAEQTKKGIEPKYTMTQYYLVLLNKGEKWTADSTPETRKLQLEHLWNIRRMLDSKNFVSAGPLGGNQDLLGLFVINAKSMDEAKSIAETDPAVKAGRLAIKIHPWWVAKEVWP